jgi:hypothetical protein
VSGNRDTTWSRAILQMSARDSSEWTQEFDQDVLDATVDPLDGAATAHPGSQGSQYRSAAGTRAGVEDENREFPITARDVLTGRRFTAAAFVNLFIASGSIGKDGVAGVLTPLFAAIRPSTTDATTRGADQSTRFAADSKEPTQSPSGRQSVATSRTSKLPVAPTSTPAMTTAGQQRYQTDHGFVAEDFTNHFDPQAHNIATLQSSERNARDSVKPKRIVVVN